MLTERYCLPMHFAILGLIKGVLGLGFSTANWHVVNANHKSAGEGDGKRGVGGTGGLREHFQGSKRGSNKQLNFKRASLANGDGWGNFHSRDARVCA